MTNQDETACQRPAGNRRSIGSMATDGAVGPRRASGRTARRQRPPTRAKLAKPRLGRSQRRHRAPAPARSAADRRASRGRSRPLRTRSAAIHLQHWRRTSELRLTSAVRVCAPCRSGKNWWAFRCDCLSHPERDTKAKDFSCRIALANQPLINPYCFAEVRRFGEYGLERDEFRLRHGSLGQQLWWVNRADTGVFVGAARRQRALSR